MLHCNPPVCLVCRQPILTVVDNQLLGEFAGQSLDSDVDLDWDVNRDVDWIADSRPCSDRDPSLLSDQMDLFAEVASAFGEAAGQASQDKNAVLSNTSICVDGFNLAVDGMLDQLEEYRARWLAQVHSANQEREKALEAQIDLLTVPTGQLEACVAIGRAAVTSGDVRRVCEAAQTARGMEGLLAVRSRLCKGTRLTVLCDMAAALACLEEGTRLQHFEVDAARSSASGDGLIEFAEGGAAHNVIEVTCRDRDGMLADWTTLENADVGITLGGVTTRVGRAVFTKPGVIQVTYVVEEEGAQEVEVGVSLCGVAVPGSPWRARTGFMAKGVYITTLPLRDEHDNAGLAITSDDSLMVVSNSGTEQLSVYRTHNGTHVRSFGGLGVGAGEFDGVRGLCMTADDTVLVAEFGNERIQEVTLEGVHVKFIAVGETSATEVAVHGDVVAVSTYDDYIRLFSRATGTLLRQMQPAHTYFWKAICFAPGGNHVAISTRDQPITLVSVDGQTVTPLSPNGVWRGVAFTCTGDVVGLKKKQLDVFSATDGTHLRSWGTKGGDNGQFVDTAALVVSRNRVYVLDGESARVQVFE